MLWLKDSGEQEGGSDVSNEQGEKKKLHVDDMGNLGKGLWMQK